MRATPVFIVCLVASGCSSPPPAAENTDGAHTDGGHPVSHTDGGRPADPEPLDPNAAVVPNLDSAILRVDPVAGARDYRAYAMRDGVEVSLDGDGRETVTGATIYCAGLRQHGGPALPTPEVSRQIEVTDLHGPTTFIIEAIDRLCPFPGLFGAVDTEFDIGSPDAMTATPELVVPVPIVTEASIRARYGSLIVNGQGPAAQRGLPADSDPPRVLQRWTVEVSPLDAAHAAQRRTATFFADFSQNDPPQWVTGGTNDNGTFHAPEGRGYSIAVYQNSQFSFYATNAENVRGNHAFYDRGQLHMVLPDLAQDTMGTVMAVARTPAHFSDASDSYLHVTFETQSNSTNRRYWWLSLCGADTPGGTFASTGLLSDWMVLTSGFFGSDGANPSVAGWNCLVVFPHDGISTRVPASGSTNPESSLMVLIHKSNTPMYRSSVDVSPQQLNDGYPRAWYRQQHGGQVTERGILDDVLDRAPRSHIDLYVSRQRLVMYVNGEQRICNDFGPERLTMADVAVGFNDALYHSSAEHTELTASFADRSGQLDLLNNTIFAEMRSWDNVGFEENVPLPTSYDPSDCYTHAP